MSTMKEDPRLSSTVNTALEKFHECIDLGSEKGQELCAAALFARGTGLKHGVEIKSLNRGDINYAREHLFDLDFYCVYSPSSGVYVSNRFPAVHYHSNEMVSSNELFLAQLHFTPGQLLCLSDFEILMYDAAYFYALNAMDLSTYFNEEQSTIRNHVAQQLQTEILTTLYKNDAVKLSDKNSSDLLPAPLDQEKLRQTLCCNRFHRLRASLEKDVRMTQDLKVELATISKQYLALDAESPATIIDMAMTNLRTFVLRKNALAHYKHLSRRDTRYERIQEFEQIPTTYSDLRLYLTDINAYHFSVEQKHTQQIADYQAAMRRFDRALQLPGRESHTLQQFIQLAKDQCTVRHQWGESIYVQNIPLELWGMANKDIEADIAYMHLYADLIERCKKDASEEAHCFAEHGLNLLNYSRFLKKFKKEHFFPLLQEKCTHLLQRSAPSSFEELLKHMLDLYSLKRENWDLNTALEEMDHILNKRASEFQAPVAMKLEALAEKEQSITERCKVQITIDCQNLQQCFEHYRHIMPNELRETTKELLVLRTSNQPIWQNMQGIELYDLTKKFTLIMKMITHISANATKLNEEYDDLLKELKTLYFFLNKPEIADEFGSAQVEKVKQKLNTILGEENPDISLETLRKLTPEALNCINHYKEQFRHAIHSATEARDLLPTIYNPLVSTFSAIEEASHLDLVDLEKYSKAYPYVTIVNARLRLRNISEKPNLTEDEQLLIKSAMTVARFIDHNLEQNMSADLQFLKINGSLLQYTNRVLDSVLRIEDGAFPQPINAFDRSKFEQLKNKRPNDNAEMTSHRLQMAIGAILFIASLIVFVTMCGLDAGLSYNGAVLSLSLMTKNTVYGMSAGGVIAGGYMGYTNRYRLHREITQQQCEIADIEKIQNFVF